VFIKTHLSYPDARLKYRVNLVPLRELRGVVVSQFPCVKSYNLRVWWQEAWLGGKKGCISSMTRQDCIRQSLVYRKKFGYSAHDTSPTPDVKNYTQGSPAFRGLTKTLARRRSLKQSKIFIDGVLMKARSVMQPPRAKIPGEVSRYIHTYSY